MKTHDDLLNEFCDFSLNVEQMNRLRGGDGPIPPDPPGQPAGK